MDNKRFRSARAMNYMKDFQCIGGSCEDNCCIGWDVDIDLKTYQKYRQVSDPELSALYRNKIKPYPYFFSEEVDYARVKLGKGKRCPFLTPEGLCKTQAKLGETYLSNVCATYPRMSNLVDGVLESTLTLSCPVAARLVLLQEKPLAWVAQQKVPRRFIVNLEIDTAAAVYKKHPVRHFHRLRALSIEVLSDRRYPLWVRLCHLGHLFEDLKAFASKNRVAKMPEALSHWEQLSKAGTWPEPGIMHPEDSARLQLHRIDRLIEGLQVFTEIDSKTFVAYTRAYQKALGTGTSPNKNSDAGVFLKLQAETYRRFERAHPHVLENYLVNFVYKNLFPFTESEDLFEAYAMLALRFVMIRTYLIALKISAPEDAAQYIQVFAKAIEHHKHFSEQALTALRSGELLHMTYFEPLLCEQAGE